MPSRLMRFLARVLPWFDQDTYDRERSRTRRVLHQANRALDPEGRTEAMRASFQHGDQRLGGR